MAKRKSIRMKKAWVLGVFGTQGAIAKVLGISQSAVSQWPEYVPELSARELRDYLTQQKAEEKCTQ